MKRENVRTVVLIVGMLLLAVGLSFVIRRLIPNPNKVEYIEDLESRKKLQELEKTFAVYKDSMSAENRRLMRDTEVKEDSLAKSEEEIARAEGSIQTYVDKIRQGERIKDSLKVASKDIDSLVVKVNVMSTEIKVQKALNDSIKSNYKTVIENKDKEIDEQSKLYTALRQSYDKANENYDKVYKENTKLHRKNNRKFSVGIGVGYGVGVDLQPKPVVAVTVSKDIFRF